MVNLEGVGLIWDSDGGRVGLRTEGVGGLKHNLK